MMNLDEENSMLGSKKDMIKNLSDIKLIIGNGYDLHCHLKSKYKDYFNYDQNKNHDLSNWEKSFVQNGVYNYLNLKTSNHNDFWVNLNNFDSFNIWDLFFFLKSKTPGVEFDKWNWCDIEKTIEISLKQEPFAQPFNWSTIYNILALEYRIGLSGEENNKLLAAFAYRKHNEKPFESRSSFYTFLLDQLKLFEKNFGKYIESQHRKKDNNNPKAIKYNRIFQKNSRITLKSLCNINSLVSVESFNYDSPEIKEIKPIFHNINGDVHNPIFGIDSDIYTPSDPRYIFSKTNRRMELDMFRKDIKKKEAFRNIIIYGHSLNKADYNYFFSIFDQLNICDAQNDSKIIFAFSIYKREIEDKIRTDLRRNIADLFSNYSIYRGNEKAPNRLLDFLAIQGKVLTFEIPEIEIEKEPEYF